MKIIIYIDFSSKEFNKDFIISNALLSDGHAVLLVNSNIQLESAYKTYDILLWGNSYSGDYEFNKLITYRIKDLNIEDILRLINKKDY